MVAVPDDEFITQCDRQFIPCYPIKAPTITGTEGQVVDNAIGINIRSSLVSPGDFSRTKCTDNPQSEDGCFSETEREVPDLSELVAPGEGGEGGEGGPPF